MSFEDGVISSDDAERAVDWLRDNAAELAKAKAERIYLEQWIKTVRAKCMQKHPGASAVAQERDALVDPEYLAALQGYRTAVENDERYRWLATAAEAKLEAWRSQESTRRAEGKAYS